MGFVDALKVCIVKKYASIDGRACRSEYWWFALFGVIINIISVIIPPLEIIILLALLLPGICVTARRLHDINRSGWWMLVILIPFVGVIVMLVWTITKGTQGSNQFGEDPLASDIEIQFLGNTHQIGSNKPL